MKYYFKHCKHCGSAFKAKRRNKRYCSNSCKQLHYLSRKQHPDQLLLPASPDNSSSSLLPVPSTTSQTPSPSEPQLLINAQPPVPPVLHSIPLELPAPRPLHNHSRHHPILDPSFTPRAHHSLLCFGSDAIQVHPLDVQISYHDSYAKVYYQEMTTVKSLLTSQLHFSSAPWVRQQRQEYIEIGRQIFPLLHEFYHLPDQVRPLSLLRPLQTEITHVARKTLSNPFDLQEYPPISLLFRYIEPALYQIIRGHEHHPHAIFTVLFANRVRARIKVCHQIVSRFNQQVTRLGDIL